MAFSFGAPSAPKPAASTFSFGAPSTSTPSLFGSTPAPATTSAPSLFGSTPASAAPTTSLFGGLSQPATTPSLFGGGASTTTSQPNPTPSLFGGAGTQSTSLFGNPQPQQQQQQQQGTSLFGQPQPQQTQTQPQPAVTSAPLFGQSQSAATSSLFGSKPSQSAAPSLFGSSTTPFSQSQSQSQPPALTQSTIRKLGDPLPLNPSEPSIESRIESIKAAYDPNNPKCRFQTYFYNEVPQGQSAKGYGRPPNGTDERAWLKAVKENPDPDHLVPAIAIGFPSLQKRIDSQSTLNNTHQLLLSQIHSHVSSLSSTHSLTTSLRLLRAQQTSLSLLARLTSLVAKSSGLSSGRNQSLRREEEELRILLEGMKGEVERVRNRGNELWTGLGAVRRGRKEGERVEWAVADEQGFNQIIEVLSDQQRGLDHLTKTLEMMSGDVDTMNQAFGLPTLSKAISSGRAEEAGLNGSVARR
ncbi:uncharacterized protein JCM6883_002958 [Sporobolomyces salmoneus]|uniref:uncharacterized protein n=1 Tax=Sporobolomyces salmoneus TaxID=183962 RepID=UPI00317CC42C